MFGPNDKGGLLERFGVVEVVSSLKHDVAHSEIVRWSDVESDANNETIKTRKAMETAFAKEG
ncbi:MAG TPA: hypothetical protein VF901_25905 [Bradyrhizobium sp.]